MTSQNTRVSSGDGIGSASSRRQVYLCTCQSYCDGGQWVPRATRSNHRRDEERSYRNARLTHSNHTHSSHLPPSRPHSNHSHSNHPVSTALPPTIVGQTISLSADPHADQIKIKFRHLMDEMEWLRDIPIVSLSAPLDFRHQPLAHGVYRWPSDQNMVRPNEGFYALHDHRLPNKAFLWAEERYCSILRYLKLKKGFMGAQDLIDTAMDGLLRLTKLKESSWNQQRIGSRGRPLEQTRVQNTEPYFLRSYPANPTVRAACLMSVVLENLFFVPRRALRTQLSGIRALLRQSGVSEDVISSIPKDLRTCSSYFDLDPTSLHFISCPRCHKLYPYDPLEQAPPLLTCANRRAPESQPCGEALWTTRQVTGETTRHFPRKRYQHQTLKSWLGRLLCRPGMETLIDGRPHVSGDVPPDVIDDIWQSSIIINLKDHEGNKFYPGPEGEGRLIFGLSVDGFNPFGNKTARQSASSTGIWLVLLNLPWHLRYLPENIYLAGVIPGVNKPSLDEINDYIQLVVDEFLEFWDPGVYYSRTCKYELGRLIRAMLVPIICDMPAVRQIIGYASGSTAHYFCMHCDLDIDDIEILDRREWPLKDLHDVRSFAELWKNAKSVRHRESIFNAFGWRWSPLFDLKYFDPLSYPVVESMHALDLNALQNHCRDLFRIDLSKPGGGGTSTHVLKKEPLTKDKKKLLDCLDLVRSNDYSLVYDLVDLHRKVLYTFCVLYDIKQDGHNLILGSRWRLAQNITTWRHRLGDPSLLDNLPPYPIDAIQERETGLIDIEERPIEDEVEVEDVSGDESDIDEDPQDDQDSYNDDDELDEVVLPGLADLPQNARSLALRVMEHLIAPENQLVRRERAFKRSTARIYRVIFEELDIPVDAKLQKSALHRLLLTLIDQHPEQRMKIQRLITSETSVEVDAVLGKDVMEQVWSDMTRTQLPSWITPAPPNWGTTKRGKLSANNWRVVCTIHLPITLIWIWKDETGRKRDLLDNFMHLVSAVRIANMRVSSPSQIEHYEALMGLYLAEIRLLFPHERLTTSQHAALHIGDMLRRFGPSHSHSAPYYERYIAFFHRMNHNRQIGQLESTLFRTSARNANVRSLLADDPSSREAVGEMLQTMQSIELEDLRGYQLVEDLNTRSFGETREMTLDPEHFEMLSRLQNDKGLPPGINRVASVNRVVFRGMSYGTFQSSHFKDSAIIFQTQLGSVVNTHAGVIDIIFRHWSDSTLPAESVPLYAAVREYHRVIRSDLVDPYIPYGFAAGYLCEATTGQVHIVEFSQIVSHCILTIFPDVKLVHVLPIDMAMTSF